MSRIYKDLKKLTSKRTNNLINKWANKLNMQFSEGKIQMADRIHEEMFNILSYKGNANQNCRKGTAHPSLISKHQEKKQQTLESTQGKRNLQTLLVGI
jgi:hypothetical protein